MRLINYSVGCVVCIIIGASHHAAAQAPLPSFPLYCQGPLTTGSHNAATGESLTAFKWAPKGAGAATPGPGECSWADRAARGTEILSGGGNRVCDYSGAMAGLPAGKFLEVGVYRDPAVSNCMHLTHFVGLVTPAFSAVPTLPPFVRQSISALSPAQITSLRHGVAVMMSRPASDPRSYRFQANIHGTYDTPANAMETAAWNQCEHGSFYFFSWHRMYLYFFDRILRAAAGDPQLVLPYWNWADPAQRALPVAFRTPAAASNPLYLASPGRPAALDLGTAQLGVGTVDFSTAFADTQFMSAPGSGSSFGGQKATANQFNYPHGELESQPHDVVHVALGGLMDDPDTAAQDPIFWLHHANIDRLWKRWLQQGGGRADPVADAAWMNTDFTFFDEAGHEVHLTGSEIIDTVGSLNYRYDDDPAAAQMVGVPKVPLPRQPLPRPVVVGMAHPLAEIAFKRELLAESAALPASGRIQLSGRPVRVLVPLRQQARQRVAAMMQQKGAGRIMLQLADLRFEKSNGTYYEIYLNPVAGAPLDLHNPGYVGTLSLFGLKPHAMAGHAMPQPDGVFAEYDISRLVRDMTARGVWNSKEMTVTLVPRGLVNAEGQPLPVAEGVGGTLGSVKVNAQ